MLIDIYTYIEDFDEETIIIDNDAYFNENVVAKTFGSLESRVIKEIDNATIIDYQTGAIKTSYGIGALENLSTGCKTVLNYIYVSKNDRRIKALDASFCGANALEVLFSTIEELEYPLSIVLRHRDELYKCKEREYRINGERVIRNLLYI